MNHIFFIIVRITNTVEVLLFIKVIATNKPSLNILTMRYFYQLQFRSINIVFSISRFYLFLFRQNNNFKLQIYVLQTLMQYIDREKFVLLHYRLRAKIYNVKFYVFALLIHNCWHVKRAAGFPQYELLTLKESWPSIQRIATEYIESKQFPLHNSYIANKEVAT